MLSKSCEAHFRLMSAIWSVRRGSIRFIKPSPEIPVHKEVHPQEGHEVGEAPTQATPHLKILQEQDGNKCCPNLDMNRISTGPNKGFNFQVLLDRLEKQLDLPALLVDRANRARRKFHVVGQENDLPLLLLIPYDYPAQDAQIPAVFSTAGEVDHFVGKDRPFWLRDGGFHGKGGPVFEPGDEEDLPLVEAVKESVIHIATVHGHNRPTRPCQGACHANLMRLAFGDHSEAGKASVMVEQKVKFDGSLGPAELRLVKHLQAEIDDRRIQAEEFVFKPEGLRGSDTLAADKQLHEDFLEELPWSMRIGVRQRGAFRRVAHTKVSEFSFYAGQATADLAQAVRPAKLAKQHRNKLRPAVKSLGCVVRSMLRHSFFEVRTRKKLQQLAEDTAKLSHGGEPPDGDFVFSSPSLSQRAGSPFNFSIPVFFRVLDKSDPLYSSLRALCALRGKFPFSLLG